ncbi:membrane lipoprotein lipid attachment site-containing protein [Paucisalibacillus sp. EB02]|uniref:membrane lipoprotein lipid attachment site-containing protein n=1 Tax=Paucisalibacillus sp. EB02 TaxID=1347087 RepID=UPI0005A8F357|nr:membrane lipoprotein lipid attachment site-containing protein [Paucisalibacillus sp. EB02]
MMKKILFLTILMVILAGCNTSGSDNGGQNEDKPPHAYIEIDGERYDTVLGTYCWKNGCVDTAGAKDLLEGKSPIPVEAGTKVTFWMDYEPMPNEVHLNQTSETGEVEVSVTDHTFTVPDEEGLYYYDYGVWWSDGDVSDGDAFYAFALLVK